MFENVEEMLKQLFKRNSVQHLLPIFQNPLPEISQFEKKFHYFSLKPLVGKVTTHKEGMQAIQKVLFSIHEKISNPQERCIATTEILTKVLAYRDLQKGDKISIPWADKHGTSKLYNYDVHTILNLSDGMPAFGLIPLEKEAHPILLYRGTDFTLTTKRGIASLLADLDISGPGRGTFLKARPQIKTWLEYVKERYKPAAIMGYSLGGVLTTYTLLYEKELVSWDPTFPSYAYHPPGLSRTLYKEWMMETRPPFLVYYHKNDLVSKIGTHVGEIYQITLDKPLIGIFAHTSLISSKSWKQLSLIKM